MTVSLQFVHVNTATAGQPGAISPADRQAIRSQVMRDFRRRQRETARASFQADTPSTATAPEQKYRFVTLDRPKTGRQHPNQDGTYAVPTETERYPYDGITTPGSLPGEYKIEPAPSTTCLESHVPHCAARHSNGTGDCCNDCQRRKQFLKARTLPSPVPQSIRSPATLRGPMLESFIEGFYPRCVWTDPKMIGVVSSWAVARSKATLHINDAVGLTQLGMTKEDPRLVMEGRKRHVVAVTTLRREINDSSYPIEIVSSAVISMMMAEMFTATSSGPMGCATHLAGVTAVLHAHLKQANARAVDSQVLRHYYRLILMQGLIHRRAICLHEALTNSGVTYPRGSCEALVKTGLRLPGLLEATDCICDEYPSHTKPFDQAVLANVATATSIGQDLDTWLHDYQKDGYRYRLAPLEFCSSVDGNVLGLYWSLRLLLAESLYMLEACSPPTTANERAMLPAKAEASMYATLLKKTATALESFDGARLSQAAGMRAPMHFAKSWWMRLGDTDHVQRIVTMETRLQADLPGIEWISLLYWSFMAASWLT